MLWFESMRFASDLAWAVGGSSGLTPEQQARVSDEMYWRSRWGRVIRGPSWGTVLGTTHVERLGVIAQVERAVAPARVVPLGSGGAFVQATPIDAPIVELADNREPLVQLSRGLEPVMGHRL